MSQIYVSDKTMHKDQPSGSIHLRPIEWNDWWEYKNVYSAIYKSESGKDIHLGQVKIQDPQQPPQPNPVHPLPLGFNKDILPENLVSLGQTDQYYTQISKLPDLERASLCTLMRDAVWDSTPIVTHKAKPAVKRSLLREVALKTVRGEWTRILRRESDASHYNVRYTHEDFTIEFVVNPELNPSTNIHAIIGRNGVGKTTLLRRITELLATGSLRNEEPAPHALEVLDEEGNDEGILAGVQYVSWSAFDKFQNTVNWSLQSGISYSQIGIDGIYKSDTNGLLRKPAVRPGTNIRFNFGTDAKGLSPDLDNLDTTIPTAGSNGLNSTPEESFVRAFGLVIENDRASLWLSALDALSTDPVFHRLPLLSKLRDCANNSSGGSLREVLDGKVLAREFQEELSDGHKVVLLTTTYLAATLAEQTLVILDEPEAHLHPPLLSSLIRCLSEMLANKNAMAIVATHSPVVLQEVPRKCVWKIKRNLLGATRWLAERPSIETFGEDVGALTHEVFELEADESGYTTTLQELASRYDTYEDALASIDNQLGVSGRTLLRSLIAVEHPGSRERNVSRRS